jgi:hypothetical protein
MRAIKLKKISALAFSILLLLIIYKMVQSQSLDSFGITMEMKIAQSDTIQVFYDNGNETFLTKNIQKK